MKQSNHIKTLKKLFLTALALPILVYSQSNNYNEAFLKSLPDELQNDLIIESKNKKEDSYTSPDTRVKKLESALADIERDITKIRISLDYDKDNEDITRFGENFFDSFQASFLPVNQPGFISDYVVDISDELNFQYSERNYKDSSYLVLRDGSVVLPDIGKVFVAGKTLLDISQQIQELYSQAKAGSKAYISLSSLRDINVLIIGNAENPGMYTLSGGSSPLDLINVAGGIEKNGSYRNILHKRSNKIIQQIDLYEILINGNVVFKSSLRSGDVLIVQPKGSEVVITGGVSKPAKFELLPGENFDKLLQFAGLLPGSDTQHITHNSSKNDDLITNTIDLTNTSDYILQNGDSIHIPYANIEYASTNVVKISGAINFPGEYSLSKHETILDLIKKAGGYKKDAYPYAGSLIRESAKKIEKALNLKAYNEIMKYVVANQTFTNSNNGSTAFDYSGLYSFLNELRDIEPSGRVISEFDILKIQNDLTLNRPLQDGDEIHIPFFTKEVYVFGEVLSPTTVSYDDSFGAEDYINLSGGLTRYADSKRVFIVYPDGKTSNVSIGNFRVMKSLFDELIIPPGSSIYVPREIGKIAGIQLASTVAPIISSFALSIASLNAIN